MTEKIAWFEEVLHLEPNSKLFFPLAQAYTRDQRPEDAVALLRKGLAFHPEHLEARLLLIECISQLDAASKDFPPSSEETPEAEAFSSPELESLTKALAGHPAFWRKWAARSRAEGRTELAVTLDMLATLLGGARITWGTLLEQGLRAVTGGREEPPAPAPLEEQAPSHPEPDTIQRLDTEPIPTPEPDLAPDRVKKSELRSEVPSPGVVQETSEPEALPEEESLDTAATGDTESSDGDSEWGVGDALENMPESAFESTLGQTAQAPSAEPKPTEDPSSEAEPETPLSEGEQRYYETKTYADLLAKQGEHEDALDLYAKLLQTSPDDEQRRDLEARIQELRDRASKGPKDSDPKTTETKDTEPRWESETKQEFEPEPGHEPGAIPEPELSTEKDEAPRDAEDPAASSSTSPSPKTATTKQTLKKLAERLESRAGK